MRRARVLALSLLLLAGFAWWFYAPRHRGHEGAAAGAFPIRAANRPELSSTSGSPVAPSPAASGADLKAAGPARSFNQRLRCTQLAYFHKRQLPQKELALLCERKPLQVLQAEAPLARAGDPHAINVVALIANFGHCETLAPGPDFPNHRTRMIAIAQRNGATPQTVQRLEDLLAEEERGPTAEELDACRRASKLLAELGPGAIEQFAGVLGRSVQALRGENELDLEIEYSRKTLMHGDAEAEEHLGVLLLQKETPESQAEAIALLEQAAASLPSAKSTLARCLLEGCPTPAADRSDAHKLLTDAAAAGDLMALQMLAGPAFQESHDVYPDLPAPERYAWGQFLERLQEEGCFGSSNYSVWALSRDERPGLRAMSPADAATAQARAAELLGAPLERTRALLGCQ
jgi:hypothetical protein